MPQTKDQKRRKAADMYASSISGWRSVQHQAQEVLTHTKDIPFAVKDSADSRIANAADKIVKLRVLESNTRAAIGR